VSLCCGILEIFNVILVEFIENGKNFLIKGVITDKKKGEKKEFERRHNYYEEMRY